MGSASEVNLRQVLCVGGASELMPAEVVAAVSGARVTLASCSDVYRAMARIGQHPMALILVCVDGLVSSDFEFFEIVSRRRDAPQVLVWSTVPGSWRLERAIRMGATGELSLERLRDHLPAAEGGGETLLSDEGNIPIASDRGIDAHISDAFAPTDNVFDAALDTRLNRDLDEQDRDDVSEAAYDESGVSGESGESGDVASPVTNEVDTTDRLARQDLAGDDDSKVIGDEDAFVESDGLDDEFDEDDEQDEEDADDELESRPVRVPWIRHDDLPRREPPRRPPPAARKFAVDDDPPLLSAEELDALLGPDR